jgi:hypothetical protein
MAAGNSVIPESFSVASDSGGSFYVVAFWPDRLVTSAFASRAFLIALN